MKRALYIMLVLQLSCISLFPQNKNLKTGSLPVYEVVDKYVSDIFDGFILEAQNYSDHYPSIAFFMYINLYDNNDLDLSLELRKQENHSDSIILYKHPNCRQILVSHDNHLFVTVICKRPDFDRKVQPPTALLKKTRNKHKVYYKKPPLDYFRDNPIKGEVIYEDQLFEWDKDYYHGQWQEEIIEMIFNQ